ncbi:MAG: UvrD-helicase domain-containing protein, partial [Alistipes sp.]|nr:UvrD-helicase domain-containing protein [Candidatus Minthomonas equi]
MKTVGKFDLSLLDAVQAEAVEYLDGPSLIIAGAGSGKTRVLTFKIANLLTRGVTPGSILALTFTNKASREMKERISSLVGEEKAARLWMGTFHSIFIRILRHYADFTPYPASFTVYDTTDTRSAIRQCIKELELDDKTYKPQDVASRISMAKNNLVTASAYKNNPVIIEKDRASRKGQICDIYELYARKCLTAGAMDFDDILLNMNILLRDHPEV